LMNIGRVLERLRRMDEDLSSVKSFPDFAEAY